MRTELIVYHKKDVDVRLDTFISDEIEDVSRSNAKKLIENGQVFVNEQVVTKSGYFLKGEEKIRVSIDDPVLLDALPENIPINIIYQDKDFAIINKQQGLVTHPAVGTPNRTLVNAILYWIKDLSDINGVIRPGIVHRLDKDTSGLIIIAKNNFSHNVLASEIAEKTAKRYYIALVDGNIKDDSGIIEQNIDRSKNDRKKMAVSDTGRYAKTLFKVLERFGSYTLVEYELFTGRTHQIRVHSAYIHHPIVGDKLYGGSNKFGLNGQLLHAFKLKLIHPTTAQEMTFDAPLPDYFEKVLQKLRANIQK